MMHVEHGKNFQQNTNYIKSLLDSKVANAAEARHRTAHDMSPTLFSNASSFDKHSRNAAYFRGWLGFVASALRLLVSARLCEWQTGRNFTHTHSLQISLPGRKEEFFVLQGMGIGSWSGMVLWRSADQVRLIGFERKIDIYDFPPPHCDSMASPYSQLPMSDAPLPVHCDRPTKICRFRPNSMPILGSNSNNRRKTGAFERNMQEFHINIKNLT